MKKCCCKNSELCQLIPTGNQCCVPNSEIRPVWVQYSEGTFPATVAAVQTGGTSDGLITMQTTGCNGLLVGGSDPTQTFVSDDPLMPTGSFWGANGIEQGNNGQDGCFRICIEACTKMEQFIFKFGNANVNGEFATFNPNDADDVVINGNFTETQNSDGTVTYISQGNSGDPEESIYVYFNNRTSFCFSGEYGAIGEGTMTMWTAAVYSDVVEEHLDCNGETIYTINGEIYEGEVDCSVVPKPIQSQCPQLISRYIIDDANLQEGVDAGYFGIITPSLTEGETDDNLPDIDTIRDWKSQNLDYSSVATSVQSIFNIPDQVNVGTTDAGFIEFWINEPIPTNVSWSFGGEGFICLEIDQCGCGNYETIAEAFGPFSHNGSGILDATIPAGIHKVRITQIDIEGSNNLWVPNAATSTLTTFAPSTGSLKGEVRDVLVDCDQNYTTLEGSPILGTVLSPVEDPCIQEKECTKTIYYWGIAEEGVLEEIWTSDGNFATHDNVSNIFNGINHINGAPDVSTVVPDFNDTTAGTNATGTDQAQWSAFIYVPADGTQIQDVNVNTGERLRSLVGRGCCPPVVTKEITVNTPASDRGLGIFATENQGWIRTIVQMSDLSATGGVQLQIDNMGDGSFTNYNGPVSVRMPELKCRIVPCDYQLQEMEFDCPQSLCSECDPIDIQVSEPGLDETSVNELISAAFLADPHPAQEICTGDFSDVTGRTGWTHPWTPSYTANSGTVIEDWVQISTVETSPNCETDITVNVSLGNSYMQLRNMWGRVWYDIRLLIDGAPVTTWTFQSYHYEDDLGGTNLDDDIVPMGSAHFARSSVPAGALITVEILRRHNFVAGNAAIAAPFGRVISGLRSHFNVHYSPTQIVTGRV